MRLLLSTALLLCPLAPPTLAASDLEALVADEIAAAAGRPADEIWERSLMVRQAESLEGSASLDAVLDGFLTGEDPMSPEAVLFLAASRLQGSEVEPQTIHARLVPLLGAADDEIAMSAAGLLGNGLFRRLGKAERTALGQRLMQEAQSAARAPEVRMRFAQSAFRVGRSEVPRQAKKEMRAFLESSDPELRALGALALAQAGVVIEDRLREELERLAGVPSQRGILAAAYIKHEDIREYHERVRRELQAKLDSNEGIPANLREVLAVMRMIENRHLDGDRVDEERLLEAALGGMLRYMDEHSSFLSSQAYPKFLLDLEAEYGGIGAYVGMDPVTGIFTINRPIYSGPAYRAGLMTDDKIVRIDDWPTLGETVDDIIKRLKGKPNTEVKLYVWRRGMDPDAIERPGEDMAVVLKREAIQIPAVSTQLYPGGIGMIELATFSRNVAAELEGEIQELRARGMRAIVLDLRRNSGGLLTEARGVADLFLPPKKLVVTTEGSFGEPERLSTTRPAVVPEDMPVVVLTSRFTASASEIVAGALKDHKRATILGELTFGKGSVQQLMPVIGMPQDEFIDENENGRWDGWEPITADHDGDGVVDYAPRVKLTIARYLLPSGRSIHRELDEEGNVISEGGIEPDVEVKLPMIESWRVVERRRLRQEEEIRRYVDEHWEANLALFQDLAVCDFKDEDRYPDFDELMVELGTTLPRNDVRMLVRNEVRRRVQDLRGAEFPMGDFQEDYQVQQALQRLLAAFDESADAYDAYGHTFLADDDIDESGVVAVDLRNRRRLRSAAVLLREMREGQSELSVENLEEVLEILAGDSE